MFRVDPEMSGDELAARLAGYYEDPDETETDFDNLVLALRAHLDTPWWVLMAGPDGQFWGFMSWLRTDETGAALIRQFGFIKLVYLALPLAMKGPHCVMMYAAVDSEAPAGLAHRLWVLMRKQNLDAASVQTYIRRPGRPFQWLIRRYGSARW